MEMMRHPADLAPEQVRKTTNSEQLGFATTADLPPPLALIGQARAQESIDFALQMGDTTYNLYVSGPTGSGRLTSVVRAVQHAAESATAAPDWCYVYRFDQPGEPRAIALGAGEGTAFAHDVDAFVADCRREMRRAFGSDAYRHQHDELLREVIARRNALVEGLDREALAHGFMLQGTPGGLAMAPVRRVGQAENAGSLERLTVPSTEPDVDPLKPLSPEEFNALSETERQRLEAEHIQVEELIGATLPQILALEQEARERLHRLEHETSQRAVAQLAEGLATRYAHNIQIIDYLHHLIADLVAHANMLSGVPGEAGGADEANQSDKRSSEGEDDIQNGSEFLMALDGDRRERPAVALLMRRYRVNVLVTHGAHEKAPVVQEINPTYTNLVGRTEFGLLEGLPYTDHLMIKPGALHRANGGYLILQAHDLLSQPHAWDALKRALRFGVMSIEGPGEMLGTPASASLRPEPIAVQLKVILIGDAEIYTLLTTRDPEFATLFKVRADFGPDMVRTLETEHFYGQFAGDVVRCAGNPSLSAAGVAYVIEEGSRWAGDQERLSAQMGNIKDLTLEASSLAKRDGANITSRAHVTRAIAARERRMGLVSDRLDDMIREGTILITTTGQVVGQVNGLTVMAAGDYAFGKPARITARTAPGLVGIVNIERETMMSGPVHSKGILILDGYLSGRYAQNAPLSLFASICFEQIYGAIEGDSASSAELYALLSSLSGVAVKQCLAVTGSVNQRGEIQAVGGLNEKVEGYFRICSARGLTGVEGVLIPRANVRNLMLRDEVVEAIATGQFHVYAVGTIDEGIEILTGMTAGEVDRDGQYPEDTINGCVASTLRAFTERVRASGAMPGVPALAVAPPRLAP